jgi:hypothetical protein
MDTRNRILGDVILVAEEVLRQWGEIRDVFGPEPEAPAYWEVLTTHFLVRLRRNSFYLILQPFAFTLSDQNRIHAVENGFRTAGEID